jgi:hypothetical protein
MRDAQVPPECKRDSTFDEPGFWIVADPEASAWLQLHAGRRSACVAEEASASSRILIESRSPVGLELCKPRQ